MWYGEQLHLNLEMQSRFDIKRLKALTYFRITLEWVNITFICLHRISCPSSRALFFSSEAHYVLASYVTTLAFIQKADWRCNFYRPKDHWFKKVIFKK